MTLLASKFQSRLLGTRHIIIRTTLIEFFFSSLLPPSLTNNMYTPIFTNNMSMMTESAQNNMQLGNGPSRIIMQMGQTNALQNNVPTSQVPSHGNIFSSDFHRNVPSHGDLTPSNTTSTSYSPTNSALTANSPSPSKTTRRGRPTGSKNKPKEARVTKVPKKKGRPLGSKNKPKFSATNGNLTIESWEGAIDYSNNITEHPNYTTNIHSAPLAILQLAGNQTTTNANFLQPHPTDTPSQRINNPTNCQCYTNPQHEPNAHGHRQHCPCLNAPQTSPTSRSWGLRSSMPRNLVCTFSVWT